nr:hypothetical protein [Escherichia coli]
MAKLDWKKLEQAFRREHARTGIKLQDWCRQNNICYGTARRYIKLRKNSPKNTEESAQKNAQKSAQIDTQKSAQKNAHGADDESSNDELRIPLYSITDWHRSPISDSHPFDQPGT